MLDPRLRFVPFLFSATLVACSGGGGTPTSSSSSSGSGSSSSGSCPAETAAVPAGTKLVPSDLTRKIGALAIDADNLYFTDRGEATMPSRLVSVPLAGGAQQVLDTTGYHGQVAVRQGVVFFLANDGVYTVPSAGGASTVLYKPAASTDTILGFTLGGDGLYALTDDGTDVKLSRTSYDGKTTTELQTAPAGARGPLLIDGADAFMEVEGSTSASLVKVPVTGGAPTVIFPQVGADPFVLDAEDVYAALGDGSVVKAPRAGGKQALLYGTHTDILFNDTRAEASAGLVLVDGTKLYMAGAVPVTLGAVVEGSISGGCPKVIDTSPAVPLGGGALDATHLYWISGSEFGNEILSATR